MKNIIIKNQTQFKSWLDCNFWLEDVIINILEPLPKTFDDSKIPTQVTLQLSLQVGGSITAGETRWIREIKIIAEDITDYSIDLPQEFIPGNCCEEIELIHVSQGIGFTLDVPETLKIVCKTLQITQQEDREEIVEPWLSNTEFFVIVQSSQLPTPEDWIIWFQSHGFKVVWRYYYGDRKMSSQVPANDYSGWFLQLNTRLNENSQGLFFKYCSHQQDKFSMCLHLLDLEVQELWIMAGKYLARFPGAIFSCGNSNMGVEDWLTYLNQLQRQTMIESIDI